MKAEAKKVLNTEAHWSYLFSRYDIVLNKEEDQLPLANHISPWSKGFWHDHHVLYTHSLLMICLS